ncbi:hypothetical protein RclHR1_16970004 [Rhizophagus clarus]|uniref:Uncharacterized protein n=1 Tax=Rhizophagus clarus TaxID=94130 RepID=A0A2Z6QMX8_9GLOM|nr:hypothetical protein RclHR1_16970004 [Rhizophagus clarus]
MIGRLKCQPKYIVHSHHHYYSIVDLMIFLRVANYFNDRHIGSRSFPNTDPYLTTRLGDRVMRPAHRLSVYSKH